MDIGELILDIMRKQIELCNSAEVVKDEKGRIVWERVKEEDEEEIKGRRRYERME